jgi:hypothetical protein
MRQRILLTVQTKYRTALKTIGDGYGFSFELGTVEIIKVKSGKWKAESAEFYSTLSAFRFSHLVVRYLLFDPAKGIAAEKSRSEK